MQRMDTEEKEAAVARAIGTPGVYSHAERLVALYTAHLISEGHERAIDVAYDAMVGARE